MKYPFPGMNPWLEQPALWRDVHHRLISAIADELAPRLRPRYFVAVETHTYITHRDPLPPAPRYPDVMLVERGGPAVAAPAIAEATLSVLVDLPYGDPLVEGYLEVRFLPTGEVVTVIELLSYTNKRAGEHREEYIGKRASFLRSRVHFVELDLLRAGKPMPHTESVQSDYRLFIRRREVPYQARFYPFSVRQPIPIFPLPLLPDDAEPAVDLNALLRGVYERAGYDLVIDYTQPPEPSLREADAPWATELAALADSQIVR